MKKYLLTKDKFIREHLESIFEDIVSVNLDDLSKSGVLFVDVQLVDGSFFELAKNYTVIVMSAKPSFKEGSSLLPLGIKGYINSNMDEVHYLQLMGVVKKGSVWLYPEFMQELIGNYIGTTNENMELIQSLTDREKQIAGLVSEGLGNKDIARKVDISEGTVKQHLLKIFRKLNVINRIELALMFKR